MMKKNIFYLLIGLMVSFSLQNCREDGNWENDTTFPFTIERDESFSELAVGEENDIKFNIVTDYDFSSLPIYVKFTNSSNLDGVLTLAGQELSPNQEYQLQNQNNTFKYIGNEQGTHELTFYVRNSKGYTQEEEFELPYAVSDFTHTKEGGNATIYQGDETIYTMKVVPNDANDTEGYQIKFNAPFNGEIKFNGVPVDTGEWHNINNLDIFTTSLTTNEVGNVSLNYTIKNNTVSHDYQIQHYVEQREIIVQSMTINTNETNVGETLNLIGVIVQTPSTSNNNVEYKTWISSASNGNTAGISNTDNAYTPYTLGNSGSFELDVSAVQAGNYTYHIQFKDEYGNESEIKSFEIVVNSLMSVTNVEVTMKTKLEISVNNNGGITSWVYKRYNKGYILNFNALSEGATITNAILTLNFTCNNQNLTRQYFITINQENSAVINENVNLSELIEESTSTAAILNITNPTYILEVKNSLNETITKTGTFNNQYL